MKTKGIKGTVTFAWVLICFFFPLPDGHQASAADKENYCFTCHTNARKLIEITREIEKNLKGKPGASAETEGEG